jgi:hypothetical protein
MPAPEISRIVNFLLIYLIPWYDLGCDIYRFADRFEMHAEAIADKGCSLNEMHRQRKDLPRIVAFTDDEMQRSWGRPGGDGNHGMKLKDYEVRAIAPMTTHNSRPCPVPLGPQHLPC